MDLANLDTSGATSMQGMFQSCSKLTSLDLSGWDTSSVTNMSNMFNGSYRLTSLDVSGFDTSQVTDMSYTFCSCSGLTSLDVSGFDTSRVTNMNGMFQSCSGLTSLDLSGWDTSSVTNMSSMFYNCSELTLLDVSGFDTSQVTDMSAMFRGSSSLSSLDVSGFDTSNVTSMSSMFYNCSELTSLDVSGFDTSRVTNMGGMFQQCSSLTSLDVSKFDTSNAIGMSSMFCECSKLSSLDVSGFDTSQVKYMNNMFERCEGLTSLDLSGWDTGNVTNMQYMFRGCSGLTSLNLSGWDTGNVTNMQEMFDSCNGLTSLDLSGWDTGKVTNMQNMFDSCNGLTSLNLSGWDTGNVTTMFRMFLNCGKLTSLDVNGWDIGNVTNMQEMFIYCSGLTSLDLSGWDTGNVTNMNNMFYGTSSLSEITLGENFSFKGKNITSTNLQALLYTPPSSKNGINYTRKWIREDEAYGPYTPIELRDNYDGASMTGKWIWEERFDGARVTLDGNGGNITGPTQYDFTQSDTLTMTLPDKTVVSRLNYLFLGWNTAADGSGTSYAGGATYTPVLTKKATLYAQWRYDNRGTFTVNHYLRNLDNTETLDATDTWLGWPGDTVTLERRDYSDYRQPAAQTVTLPSEDKFTETYSYTYAVKRFSVHFDGNDAEGGSMADQTIAFNDPQELSENAFFRTGYIFTGWNTMKNGQGTGYTDRQIANRLAGDNETLTVYAQWLENPNEAAQASNGELTLKLKAGQTLVIDGLPAGTHYEIEEVEIPDGWALTDKENETGQLVAAQTTRAGLTNTYTANGRIDILAHKRLIGDVLRAGDFSFELYDGSGNLIETVTNGAVDTADEVAGTGDGETLTNPWKGTAPVRFSPVTVNEAGTYTYTVRETIGTDDRIVYDDHVETVTVTVTDDGHGKLTAVTSYDTDGALFENKAAGVPLRIEKSLQNATEAARQKEFTFTIHMKDSEGNAITDPFTAVNSRGEELSVSDGSTIAMKADEWVEIQEMPHGCSYEITEAPAEGFELVTSENAAGTIDVSNPPQPVRFVNVYSTEGHVTLTATKVLENGTLTDGQFTFNLMDRDGNVLETATNKADGSVAFRTMDFTLEDAGKSYVYYIQEAKGSDSSYSYDEHAVKVEFTVVDRGTGELEVIPHYENNANTFTNTALGDLSVEKVVKGNGGNVEKEFTFTITLEGVDGVYATTDETGAAGSITFTSGTAETRLSHGEKLVIHGIPAGTSYTVEEEPDGEYSTSSTGDSGVIAAGLNESVFTNTKTIELPTGVTVPLAGVAALAAFGAAGLALTASKRKKEEEK